MEETLKFVHGVFMFVYLYGNISCAEITNVTYCTWNCTCLGNTVDCSLKGLDEVPEYLPVWTEILDVSSNSIEVINNLDKLQNLKELNLNGNPLVQQSFNFCETLSKLFSLKLCNVSSIVDSIVDRSNMSCGISQLYLSHNQLKEINWSFLTVFPKIWLLDLSHNNFSTLENVTLPLMTHLHNLILDDNFVNFISKDFFDSIPNVEILKLNRNRIQFLKKGLFIGMKHLKILELEYNRLVMVEGLTFKGLGGLVSLNLKKNSISKLMDGSFWGLTHIQSLDLSGNNISSIDNRWLYGLESLKQLFMAHNKVEAILDDAWKFSKNITDLNLRYNKLSNLSETSFKQLSLLRKLQLQHNNISFIHDSTFHHLTFLKTLDLGFNNLSWTSDDSGTHFDNLFSLTRLMLEHNNIRSLSRRMFRDLISLKHLNVAGKGLTSIQARAFENIRDPKYFNMDSRNLFCDCQLVWLLEWLQKNNFEVQAACGYPETIAGRQLLQLHRDELKCFSFSRPVITQEPHSINAALNGNVTLTCEAASAGKSLLHIEWKKDNSALENLNFKEISVKPVPQSSSGKSITQVVSQIILSPVINSHAGSYQCIASNVIGSTYSVKAIVTVNVFPTFVKTPELNIMARIGTTARFDCSAVGLPSPVITLQKDGGDDFPAARERRMHIYPSDERFFIVNVKPEDQGTYTCSATNTVGVISFNTTLQVLEPPKFIRRMKTNKTVMEGETVVLECQARGNPHPKVEWLKDSMPTVLTLRHFSTGESQFLIIVQTNRDDEGEYSCIISNTLGSEKQTVYLSVVVPSSEENASIWQVKEDYNSTTAGIIIIAVVCCIVVTSLAWACIIYSRTRRRYTNCLFKDRSSKNDHVIKQINADVCTDVSAIIFAKHCHTCVGCAGSKKPRHCNSICKHGTSCTCSSLGLNKITSLQCLTVARNQHPNAESLEKQSHLEHKSLINEEILRDDKNGCLGSLNYTKSNEQCFHCSLTKTSDISDHFPPVIKS